MPLPATSPALIDELEAAMDSSRSDRRVDMLRRVTDLFLANAPVLNDEQTALFDALIERLADRIESRIRRELAEKLAFTPNAPLDTTRSLARDEIEVARAILVNSTRLGEADLIDIASHGDQDRLLAITERGTLTEGVTDVLVTRGNQEVVRSVAANEGARFSDYGFGTLVERAEGDEELQTRIGARDDLPPAHFQALLTRASERVRQRLLADGAREGRSNLARMIGVLADDVLVRSQSPRYDLRAAEMAVSDLQRGGGLGEIELLRFVLAGMEGEAIVGLARLSKLAVEVVETLWSAPQNDGLVMVVRALGFNWNTLRELLKMAAPERATAESLDAAAGKFNRLRLATAQRVVRFWQVRHSTSSTRGADAPAAPAALSQPAA